MATWQKQVRLLCKGLLGSDHQMRLIFPLIFVSMLTACGDRATSAEEYYLSPLKLPDGSTIMVEQMSTPEQMTRGMMFRDELKPDRGLLFFHGGPGRYQYWMYQVKVPLDIIWVDAGRRIVEISAMTPPCEKGPAPKCPHYGGNADALFVVELGGGQAAKHGLKVGDLLGF